MDAASGAAGAAANGAGGDAATVKMLQLPPNTKNVVMQLITSAMEGLSTIQTALQDAEEAEGATMPSELLGAIEQSGMELVAFAQQHGANADAGGEAVSMSAGEIEIANALADKSPEIVKSLMAAITKSRGDAVAKGTVKVAPAQVISLIKELVDDFVGRASKWGGMFIGEAPTATVAPDGAIVANGKKDPAAALKSVAAASAARVNKSVASSNDENQNSEIVKALEALKAELVALKKSVIGGSSIDPLDDLPHAIGGSGSDDLEFAPGENMSASVRKSLNKGKKRVEDNDDEDI